MLSKVDMDLHYMIRESVVIEEVCRFFHVAVSVVIIFKTAAAIH
jgi:hypothetical protein